MGILLLKLFLSPALVVGSTLAGRRWGASVAGFFVGQPIVAGPILFITCLAHGGAFASGAAASALYGVVSLALFAVVFTRSGFRLRWPGALAAGYAAVLALDAALSFARLPVLAALAITLAAVVAALVAIPRTGEGGGSGAAPPSWDLPARAVATGLLVLLVTSASAVLGPRWTGILAPFPVAMSVVAAFVHAQHGARTTAATMATAVLSLTGFAGFCVTAALLARPLGAVAFVPAVAVSVAVQLLAVRARQRLVIRQAPGA